jgi:hypothetical protein
MKHTIDNTPLEAEYTSDGYDLDHLLHPAQAFDIHRTWSTIRT